ncbi:hypothetical protein AB0H49_24275 [Nocardia sp. NPDC050713]|uniref:hypothetical protein n=1 Tax=Nocardia sp. NPDC050713 TaxID=3154511 RepID=UPI00341039A7
MPERYEVGKVHSCEFCGTEEQTIGSRAALADAQSLAEQDAHRPLEWQRVLAAEPWPLRADPEDGHFEYVIHRRADA